MTPNEMTLDQCREWLASEDGYEFRHNSWWHPYIPKSSHPYPPTIDGAAFAMPAGWHWTREWQDEKWWAAFPGDWDGEPYPVVIDTDSEILDRYRLAVAARMAMKGTP